MRSNTSFDTPYRAPCSGRVKGGEYCGRYARIASRIGLGRCEREVRAEGEPYRHRLDVRSTWNAGSQAALKLGGAYCAGDVGVWRALELRALLLSGDGLAVSRRGICEE